MFNWLVRMWRRFTDWRHPRQILPNNILPAKDTYHVSNLHGRYR